MPRVPNGDLIARSSRPDVSCKRGVLRNFAKLTRKHLRQRFFFNKVAGLSPQACNFITKESLAQVFSYEFYEISKTPIFIEHLWWLLLNFTEMAKYTCGLKHKI